MSIFNNNKFDPFGTNSLFADINKTNQQINSMNLPAQPTPQEQDYKRQRYGNMMLALSDVLKGRDPSAGVMQRQALIEAQKKEAERKRRMAQYKKDNPGMVGMLEALEAGVPAALLSNKDSSPASVKEYQFAKQQGYTGSYEDFLKSKKATTNINTGISGFQKSAVDAYNNVQAEAKDARVINTSLDTLDNLLNKGVDTGFGSSGGLSLQRIGQSIIGED